MTFIPPLCQSPVPLDDSKENDSELMEKNLFLPNLVAIMEIYLEDSSLEMALNEYLSQCPDTLQEISHLTKSQIEDYFEKNRTSNPELKNAVMRLYITSLINSQCKNMIETLEKNIHSYLNQSSKKSAHSLIGEAGKLLSKNIHQITDREFRSLADRITAFLNLFFLNKEMEERIHLIITHATDDAHFRYPNCKKHFETYSYQLDQLSEERETLLSLRKALINKIREIAPLPRNNRMQTSQRDLSDLFSYHSKEIWNVGIEVVSNALGRSIFQRTKDHIRLPNDLCRACNRRETESLNQLLRNEKTLTNQFLYHVWSDYLGDHDCADINGLMEFILSNMPEPIYSSMKKNLANKQNALSLAVDNFLKIQFPHGITITNLKQWILQYGSS